jgi:hypothetical protein
MGLNSGRLHDAVTKGELTAVEAQLSAIDASDIGKVYDTNGETMVAVWIGTQANYDLIAEPSTAVLYIIKEAVE